MPTHKKTGSERFKGPEKYVEYLFARALITVLQRLPIGFAYRLGRGAGWLAWKLMAGRRATVRKNLEIVNAWMCAEGADGGDPARAESGDLKPEGTFSSLRSHPSGLKSQVSALNTPQVSSLSFQPSFEIASQVQEVFQHAGANLFSGFTFARMTPEQAERHLRVDGLDYLSAALEKGRGVVVLLAHMGPWEALTQLPDLVAGHGIEARLGALYRPLNNHYLEAWYRKAREAKGTRLFSKRDGFHKPVDFLRGGGMLGSLADQKLKRGEKVDFFGVPTGTSPIPGLMQRRSGAGMVAISLATEGTALWRLKIHPVSMPGRGEGRERRTEAQACNRVLEQVLSESITDGFWFHDRF